jgi:hypothetical protein
MAKSKRAQPKKRPLWTCPKCRHKFVTTNLSHSCSRYPLSYHFKGTDPIVREIFDEYLAVVESFGPVMVIPQKTRIVFQVRVRFAGAVTRKHWLDCGLWLKRRAEHPLFYKVEKLNARDHIYSFRLKRVEDLRDKNLRRLLREAYAVGRQEI